MVVFVETTSKYAATGSTQIAIKETDVTGTPNLSDDQWEALVNMFNSSKGQSSSTEKLNGKFATSYCWIIDTECSNHMTNNATLFTKLFDVSPIVVGLPNRKNTTAGKEGWLSSIKS